jgi:putative nucleotidyltransferase with HDIG domain
MHSVPRLTVDDYLERATNLPPAPRILPQLLVLLNQPNTESGRLVELISLDSGLTASVLRLCNSAYFGNVLPAGDLQEAVTRLGFRQVYQLVAAISGAAALAPALPGYGIEAGGLWQHSVTAAIAAQTLARQLRENETLVFTATLLHDLGKVVLASELESVEPRIRQQLDHGEISLLEAELQMLGVQHADTGARLLVRWQFPESMVMAVRCHHHPSEAQPHERLAACVYIGNLIACLIGQSYGFYSLAWRHKTEALKILDLQPDDLSRLMIKTVEQFEVIQALFQTSASARDSSWNRI